MAGQDAPGPDGRRLRLTGTGAVRGGIAASAAVVAARRRVSVREVVRSLRFVVPALAPAALLGWSVVRLVPGHLGAASAAIACVTVYALVLRRLGSRELAELVTTVRRVAGQVVGGRPARD